MIRTHPEQRSAAALSPLVAAMLLACTACVPDRIGGQQPVDVVLDELRRENTELKEQVARLGRLSTDLERTLEEWEQRGGRPQPPEGLEPTRCARLNVARFTGAADTDGDGVPDSVRLYLETLDAQDRFVQTLGEAQITVAAVPAGQEAVTVGRQSWSLEAFDAAYRSTFLGTHYTLLCPVSEPVPKAVRELVVTVAVQDALTGRRFETSTTVVWREAKP